jgi:hypothetical protein
MGVRYCTTGTGYYQQVGRSGCVVHCQRTWPHSLTPGTLITFPLISSPRFWEHGNIMPGLVPRPVVILVHQYSSTWYLVEWFLFFFLYQYQVPYTVLIYTGSSLNSQPVRWHLVVGGKCKRILHCSWIPTLHRSKLDRRFILAGVLFTLRWMMIYMLD